MTSRKRKSAPGLGVGCLVLIVGFLVLGVLFLVKLPDIRDALQKTKFLDLIAGKAVPSTSTTAAPPAQVLSPSPSPASTVSTSTSVKELGTKEDGAGETRQASLFFVRIDDQGGRISTREVKRQITTSDSPLTDALKALLSGPSEAEMRSGLVSLLPHGTKLLGVAVRGSTASVDLSEEFMYNRYGTEGFSAQLKQLVYTATSFPSVQDVQILVEGKTKDYLGGEGIYIGKPLSRNSF